MGETGYSWPEVSIVRQHWLSRLPGATGSRPRLPNPGLSDCAAPAPITSWTSHGSGPSNSGQHLGPRLFASGYFLTTTGGHFLTSGHALEVDGPYGWVKAIREQIKNGVDHIKLNLSGGIMGPAWDLHTHSFLLDDEIRAAFEICRKRGFKVMAHATNPDAVKNAIRLGAHSIEHGYIMDDECIALLLEHDTWYVPTLAISHLTASQATNPFEADWVAERGLSPALCCRAEAASDVHATWFRKALDAGVRMALGSDIRPLKDAALLEMGLWVRDGATPWQTLVAATRHGAAVCGVGADLGTVEVGKLADLIVVAANPLDDITNVRRLQLVLKEGRVVSDKRHLSWSGSTTGGSALLTELFSKRRKPKKQNRESLPLLN